MSPSIKSNASKVAGQRGSVLGAAVALVLLICLLGFVFLVATRGWKSAQDTTVGWIEGVTHAAKETSEDAALTGKVKTALSLSRRIPAGNIDVDSKDGMVTLRGEVPDQETRQTAETIARDTAGVSQVHNELTVKGAAYSADEAQRLQNRIDDLETRYQVHHALTNDPLCSASAVQVDVQDHVVTLTGSVATSDQKNRVQQTASQVPGVRSVNNQLQVAGSN